MVFGVIPFYPLTASPDAPTISGRGSDYHAIAVGGKQADTYPDDFQKMHVFREHDLNSIAMADEPITEDFKSSERTSRSKSARTRKVKYPQARPNPTEDTRGHRETSDYSYLLGEGDVIFVDTWTHPELSGSHVIGPDGKITLSLIGSMRLAGLTREEAAEKVRHKLEPYYPEIKANIRIEQYTGNKVYLMGQVAQPGVYTYQYRPTLLEALASAGGVVGAQRTNVGAIAAKPFAKHCFVIRGGNQVADIDLKRLMQDHDLSLNIRLQPNDVLMVPELESAPLYLMGQVRRPGLYTATPELSLMDLLTQAGGVTNDGAPTRIHVINPNDGTNTIINLKELLTPDAALDLALAEGNIVFVPRNWLATVNYVVRNLSPFNIIPRLSDGVPLD